MGVFITVIHIIVSLFLMLTVLLQSGKGGGMGAAFGGGGSTGTVFGGAGGGGFLRKLTVGMAATFMITSMVLAWLGSRTDTDALKRYSAGERHKSDLKKAAHDRAIGDESDTAPDGLDGDAVQPDGTDGTLSPDGDSSTSTSGSAGTPDDTTKPDDGASATPPAADGDKSDPARAPPKADDAPKPN